MADSAKTLGVVVVEGAEVTCSLGSLPKSPLKIKHKEDDKYFVNEKKIATWLEDDKDHMNFGTCKRSNPQPACTPDISWKDYYENAEFAKQKILIDKSQGNCKYKGTVTITRHGQTSQPSSRIYKKDNKDSYDIFMLSPKVAASQGKKLPSVSKIDILPFTFPVQPIPDNREVAFEIGGSTKNITLIATVGKNDDASLVSWAYYKGDTQKDRSKTYLEYGSVHVVKLEELPEGKTTIFGYGQTPSGESTKIIINRKHNTLEGIDLNLYMAKLGNTTEIPKKTMAVFSPKYTFPVADKNQIIPSSRIVWRIKDTKGTILYTNAPGFSAERKNSTISAGILSGSLVAVFQNSGSYIIELEDNTLVKPGMVSDKKTLTVKVKNRSAKDIVNKGDEKIRKNGSFHLAASGISFDYGGPVGLGNRVFWFVQKDNGKAISLGLRQDVRMSVPALIEEFRKKQQIITDPYGIYKFQVFGEDKSQITTIGKGSDTALIEVGKNRMESISGPVKIPVGAVATYETRLLMSPVAGENIRWIHPLESAATFNVSIDGKEATLEFKKPGKVKFSAYLEGPEVSNRSVEKNIESAGASLNKALWCYSNGKRRAETGWEEENYIHISLEGLTSTPVKIKVWVEHPEFDPLETFTKPDCLLKEIEATLNDKGSCQVSFIADKEMKEKIQKIYPGPEWQANLLFTLEFAGGKPLDLSNLALTHKQSGEEVHAVVSQGKNLYLVLDPGEYLKVPAKPRITAINFSNEAADDIQVGVTQYGKKHTIWVNTVGMPKEKLVVIVYKQLLKDDMKETYNNKEKAFAATAQVKKYEAQEVGADGLLALDFTPEKKDADGDPQLFYVAVFKEQKNDKEETELVEVGSQLKSLDSLPFDKELNKDATQVGIVMPTLEEGQTPTAEQLKEVVSKFFHFYNPLYVSETGTIEDQQVISPVLVERGESHQATCPRCNAPVTTEELKQIFSGASNETLTAVASVYTKYMEDMKMNTCWNKAHFFAQARVESGKNFMIGHGESFNYYWEDLTDGKFPPFTTAEGIKKAKEWGRSVKKITDPGYVAVSEENQKKIAEYIYGPNVAKGKELGNTQTGDGWRFRGKGLIQLTGRSNYTKINAYCKKYNELGDIVSNSDLLLEVEMAVFSSMAYWHMKAIYNDANGKKDTKAACKKVGNDLAVKDEEGKNSKNHIEKQKMFDKYSSLAFRIDDCLWGKVKDGLKFDNSDLKIQQGIDWLLTKCIDQSEVGIKNYKVKYANDSNRTSESGENTMDCSELVCRYLQKIEWSEKVMGGNTKLLHEFAEKYPEYLQKHDNLDYKPQIGDIFIWKNKSGGMGHTGVIIKYEEIQNKKGGTDEVVTTIEAISSTETPYDLDKNISMNGVIKLKWLRKSNHLLNHSLTNKKGHSVTPCRFYTPLIHYTKADKKIIWKGNSANFEIKNKN